MRNALLRGLISALAALVIAVIVMAVYPPFNINYVIGTAIITGALNFVIGLIDEY